MLGLNSPNSNIIRSSLNTAGTQRFNFNEKSTSNVLDITVKTPRNLDNNLENSNIGIFSAREKKINKLNWTNVKPKSTIVSPFKRSEKANIKEKFKALNETKSRPISDEHRRNLTQFSTEKSQDPLGIKIS